MRSLSRKQLKELALLCAGAALLLLVAAALSGVLPFLPASLKLAISNVNRAAPAASTAAVWHSYLGQSNGSHYSGFYGMPSPHNYNMIDNWPPGSGACYPSYSDCPPGNDHRASSYCLYGGGQVGLVGVIDAFSPAGGSGVVQSVRAAGGYYPQNQTYGTTPVVAQGSPVTIEWACQDYQSQGHAYAGSNYCSGLGYSSTSYFANQVIISGPGMSTFTSSSLIGAISVTPPGPVSSTHSYTLQCRRTSDGATWSASVPVQVSTAVLSLSAASPTVVPGGSTMLNWSVANTVPASCTISNQAGTTLGNDGSSDTFSYTGGNQTYQVAPGVTSLLVRLWGAGGGGQNCSNGSASGGTGGYTQASLAVTPGEVLTVITGQRGTTGGGATYGGGGAGGSYAGSGGGRSAIRNSNGTELLTAGGGGGGGNTAGCIAFAPTKDIFAEVGSALSAALLLWPESVYASNSAHLAGGGEIGPAPGNPGGGTTGNVGGAYAFNGSNTPDGYGGGGGGGYVGGASNTSFLGGYGGTGYCGGAGVSACTTTTGGGSGQNTNGLVTISVPQFSGSVSTGSLLTDTTFTLSCQDAGSAIVATSTTVAVVALCPNGTGPFGSCVSCDSGYVLQGSAPSNSCVPQCPNGEGAAGSCTSCDSGYSVIAGSCLQNLTVSPSNVTLSATRVRKGTPSTLSWTVTGMGPGISCYMSPTLPSLPSSGLLTWSPTNNPWSSSAQTANLNASTKYTLSCGTGTATTSVTATASLTPSVQEI